jgi:hypothetical protein
MKFFFPALLAFLFSLNAQAQTKTMEYKTAIPWSDSGEFLLGDPIPVGTDFLAVIVNRNSGQDDQVLYILDLKKKSLAKTFDEAGLSYWLNPSATTGSFLLSFWRDDATTKALYNFNKRTRSWSLASTEQGQGLITAAPSVPVLPGFFVRAVRDGEHLKLDVFRY